MYVLSFHSLILAHLQMCAACAEELTEGDSDKFACPQCRKRTTYIKTFEDLDETPAPAPPKKESPNVRKRGNEDEAGPSTKKPRIEVITLE